MAFVMRGGEHMRQGLVDLVDKLAGNDLVMVEVGSYAGESAELFANTGKFKRIICIDPWISDPNGDNKNSYTGMEDVEVEFDKMASNHPEIVKFKGTLDTFVTSELFKEVEGAVDFVYIDSDHTYAACKHDIETALEHLKPAQIIAGHDYADFPEHVRGVKQAVNEEFGSPDATFSDSSWCKFQVPIS